MASEKSITKYCQKPYQVSRLAYNSTMCDYPKSRHITFEEWESRMSGWIGVDLDGTLAEYGGWQGPETIGYPIPIMMNRVRKWLAEGMTVKVFTARASIPDQIPPVRAWLDKHGLQEVGITNVKDFAMITLYDDRCVQVEMNTGRLIGGEKE